MNRREFLSVVAALPIATKLRPREVPPKAQDVTDLSTADSDRAEFVEVQVGNKAFYLPVYKA